jgi:hypothetical protein
MAGFVHDDLLEPGALLEAIPIKAVSLNSD